MTKTFYVITEEIFDGYYVNERQVLYAFETHEEALYVLYLLQEEDTNSYSYDLSIVNNNHPYEKLSEEKLLSLRRERDAHKRAKEEMEKQSDYVKLSQNRMKKIQYEIDKKKIEEEKMEKKRQEREAECKEYKRKIDEFLEWLQNARHNVAIYEPNKEDDFLIETTDDGKDEEDDEQNSQYSTKEYNEDDDKYVLKMSPKEYEYEVKYRLSLIKNEIQQYLLDYQDEQVMELVNKPAFELLNLPPPINFQPNSIYVPKRLRQVMEQEK